MYTLSTTTFVLSLLSIPIASAGQHTGSHFRQTRRHHARLVQPIARQGATCEEAAWQCNGSELQRCLGNQWVPIQNCTGQDIICSAEPETTGCVWTWSVQQASAEPSNTASSATSSPSYTSPPFSPTASAPSPSETLPECDPEDLEESESSSTADPSQSVIGGNLAGVNGGGHSWYSQSQGDWNSASSSGWSAAPTASSTADWANGSPPSATGWSSGSGSTWSASATTSGQDQWGQPSASSSTADWQQSSSNTSQPTGAPSSGSGQHGSKITSYTVSDSATGTGTAAPSNSTGSPGGGSPGHWSAPHYVIYTDYGEMNIPDASELTDFNRFILAFWMSDRGAVDMAQVWEWMDAGARQKVLDSYHAAGIALMVSAFGSTDAPVTNGVDPADCARRLAAWVKQYNLDGVDIDWEDMQAMNTNRGEAWLITFQAELRRQLPAGQYLISHAPVAPWFTSGPDYESGAYVAVHREVGSGIDFYNIQFYNQGQGVYEDCNSLVFDSSASSWPDTSVMEINSFAGVPYSKIVIGKPIDAGSAANGYMNPGTLSQCVDQAESKGWNGGIMYWEWNADAPRVMRASRGE